MSDLKYTGTYAPGDRVVCTSDDLDGSYEGEEGTVIKVYRQAGGIFAPERNVEIVVWDCDDSDDHASTEAGRELLAKAYEAGDVYASSSDEFSFDAL